MMGSTRLFLGGGHKQATALNFDQVGRIYLVPMLDGTVVVILIMAITSVP